MRAELCLYGDEEGGDAGTRTRVVFFLTGDAPAAPDEPAYWSVAGLEVFRERRVGAPEETMHVDGFATPGAAISPVYAPVAVALAQGVWEADNGATIDRTIGDPPKMILAPYWGISPKPQWALAPRASLLQPEQSSLVTLPEGLWAYVEQATSELLVIELGQCAPAHRGRRATNNSHHAHRIRFQVAGAQQAARAVRELHQRRDGHLRGRHGRASDAGGGAPPRACHAAACMRRLTRGAAQAHEAGYTEYDAEDQAVRPLQRARVSPVC